MLNRKLLTRFIAVITIVSLTSIFSIGCDKPSQDEISSDGNQTEESTTDVTVKAAEIYGKVLDDVQNYDFDLGESSSVQSYQYSILFMSDDMPPQLIVKAVGSGGFEHSRVFSYDMTNDKIIEPSDIIVTGVAGAGGFRGSLMTKGNSLDHVQFMSGTGAAELKEITIDGENLVQNNVWEGQINELPERDVKEINWKDISDRSLIDILSGKSEGTKE